MAAAAPYPSAPTLAAGVSGGADSMALAILANRWVRERGGSLLAIVLDHGLRAGSADEAVRTRDTLATRGVASTSQRLAVPPGSGLQARARTARLDALARACRERGITDLLLGHHADDQAETVLMRRRAGSGEYGLAGMAAVRHVRDLRVIRPLLAVPGAALRAVLGAEGVVWIDDPSNADPAFLRSRLRVPARTDRAALLATAAHAARTRQAEEREASEWLAAEVTLSSFGYAVLPDTPAPPRALAGLLRTVGGQMHAAPAAAVAALAARPRSATLGGVRMMPAGRLGPGWLVVREPASVSGRLPATAGVHWDHRFRLGPPPQPGLTIGALQAVPSGLRHSVGLPAIVLATLPALRRAEAVVGVPPLDGTTAVVFEPEIPVTEVPFPTI